MRAPRFDRVCGGLSMIPTIQPGDPVHLVAKRPLRAGDVVVFQGTGDYEVVHRFLFKLPLLPYFVHRGDAAGAQVGLARWECVIGIADLPRRAPTGRELLAACSLILRRGTRRLVVRDERRQRVRK